MKHILSEKISFALMNLGLLIVALGVHFFKAPNHFAIGGTTGVSIILSALFPGFHMEQLMLIINAALIVVGSSETVGKGFRSM